jgi:hypothetical protein
MSELLNGWDKKTLHRDPDGEVRTGKNHFYQGFLIKKLGLADSRAYDFAKGVQELHRALCRCDYENLDTLMTAYPGIADLVQDYARLEELAVLRNYKHEEYKS